MTATVHGPTRHPVAIATGGFLALAIAIGIGRFVYTPVLPYMVAGLGLTKSDACLIASANFLGYLVGALLAARSTLPGSRRLWLLSALAMSTATTAAMAIDGSLALFLFLRLSGGIASAVVMVFASALVMDHLAAANRPAWAALLYAGVGGGIVISAMMISVVATSDADWVPLWLASGLLSLALFIIACWLLAGADPRAAGEPPAAPCCNERSPDPLRFPAMGGRLRPLRIRLCDHGNIHCRPGACQPCSAASRTPGLAHGRSGSDAVGDPVDPDGQALGQWTCLRHRVPP